MVKFCLFSAAKDFDRFNWVVKVSTGTPEEITQRAVDLGYDGIEYMPDPDNPLDPEVMELALRKAGAILPVINSGRFDTQGYALFHPDPAVRKKSIEVYKGFIDFAGYLAARVGLGAAGGRLPPGKSYQDSEKIIEEVLHKLVMHALRARVVLMLEPRGVKSGYMGSVGQVMTWVKRFNSPALSVMLDTDTHALYEPSIEYAIHSSEGQAKHIHLYDPGKQPVGIKPEKERYNWNSIVQALREEHFEGTGSVTLFTQGDPIPAATKTATFLRQIFT